MSLSIFRESAVTRDPLFSGQWAFCPTLKLSLDNLCYTIGFQSKLYGLLSFNHPMRVFLFN